MIPISKLTIRVRTRQILQPQFYFTYVLSTDSKVFQPQYKEVHGGRKKTASIKFFD